MQPTTGAVLDGLIYVDAFKWRPLKNTISMFIYYPPACCAPFIAQAACKTPSSWLWTAFIQHLFCVLIHQTAYKTFTHTLSHWIAVELRFSCSLKVTLAHPTIRGRPTRSRAATCNCSIFSSFTFLSAVELGLSRDFPPIYTQASDSATNPVCDFIFTVLKLIPA